MIIGYARVSSPDQPLDRQLDVLKRAGCVRIYQDVARGAAAARPGLDELLADARAGDILVCCKLDRLGRSLRHLVALAARLAERGVGLRSLGDPIDTTSPQGRSIDGVFASLAELDRALLRERTSAGLAAARVRGRKGGRPKGLTEAAEATAAEAEALYREGRLGVRAMAARLGVSKATLYRYLRHRGVEVSPHRKAPVPLAEHHPAEVAAAPADPGPEKVAIVRMWLRVENNSKFVRGKTRVREEIERWQLREFNARHLGGWEYELSVPYRDDADLDKRIYDLLQEMDSQADARHCFIETDVRQEGTDRSW